MASERRLAAILAADVVGSSRLVEADESYALSAIRSVLHDVLTATAVRHSGRLIKTTGDGALLEFTSPVAAVACADQVQRLLAAQAEKEPADRRVLLRIGINLGDVVATPDGDLHGDGVNVAARLEPLAAPGGIVISGKVYDELHGRSALAWEDRGDVALKNITRSVRVWRLSERETKADVFYLGKPVLVAPDRPSLAVLPFSNLSGDPEQEYFADDVVEDIITALGRVRSFFVIARNSSFTYKGKAIDTRQVGQELGVRYILAGSVRKGGTRVRITGQLIEAETGKQLWADQVDGELADVFALQDRVAERVVGTIEPRIRSAEIESALRRRSPVSTAYDLYLRALAKYYASTRESLREAQDLARRANELDPQFAPAASLQALCSAYLVAQGWVDDVKGEITRGIGLARAALDIDDSDPDALGTFGILLAHRFEQADVALDAVTQAVTINPNSASAWSFNGWTNEFFGHDTAAIKSFERALRLSPLDPMLYWSLTGLGWAYLKTGQARKAVETCLRASRINPRFAATWRCLAAAYADLSEFDKGGQAAAELLAIDPDFRVSAWLARFAGPSFRSAADSLRKVGLPQ